MSLLTRGLIQLDADLRALDLRWAVIGGLAVSVHSIPRTTEDLDAALAVTGDPQAEQVTGDLRARGYRLMTPPIEQTETGRLATVRFHAPPHASHHLIVDLMFASSGIEREIVAAATKLEVLRQVVVPVICLGHLLALKMLASRPQDLADIQRLLETATSEDRRQAEDALELISRRGFDRGKNLQTNFAQQLALFNESKSG